MLAGIIGAGCGWVTARASPPPDSAPADVVLAIYLDALVAGDCAMARALSTESFAGNGDLCGVVRFTSASPEGHPATLPSGREVVYAVDATTAGGDETMPDGEHIRFFSLRLQPNGAWRIAGGGSGP